MPPLPPRAQGPACHAPAAVAPALGFLLFLLVNAAGAAGGLGFCLARGLERPELAGGRRAAGVMLCTTPLGQCSAHCTGGLLGECGE